MRQLSVTSQPKRKRNSAFVKHSAFRPLLFSAAMGIFAALLTYAIKTGLADLASMRLERAAITTTAKTGLILNDVLVEGRENTPLNDLRVVTDLHLGQPILEIDPQNLRERIEALPWVATASVERQLPDILHIRLNEHRPIAMWQHDGTFSLINRAGDVILTGGSDIKVFSHLPLLVGAGAPEHAEQVLALLGSEPELNKHVKAAVRVSDRRWDIALENGTFIRLPQDNPEQAWTRLARYNAEHMLFDKKLASVDMRLPDRILVKIDDENLVKIDGKATIRKPLVGQDT